MAAAYGRWSPSSGEAHHCSCPSKLRKTRWVAKEGNRIWGSQELKHFANYVAQGFHSNRLRALVLCHPLRSVAFRWRAAILTKNAGQRRSFFFGASFIWYQWDVCSVSWYFVYLSYIYNLYTFTSSTYPCYNIIIWCKSRIYSHSYFTPYFSAFNLQIVFFFSNQQTHEIFACFLGGLEVHVAGLEVPHCRCRVDPASDFHSMDSQCFAALMDFFGVSQRDGFRWAVSKKQCFFLKTWNELKL